MNPVQLIPNRPQPVRRPTSLDELHRRARRAVTKLTDSTSVASPALVVADIPVNSAGHTVSGQFRLLSAGAAASPDLLGFRRRLDRLRLALGKRHRLCQITLASSGAQALSALFAKEGPVRVGEPLMHALATLIHEELHAVHYAGWPGLVQDRALETPGVRQIAEGITELGVEELLPAILPQLGLGGLRAAPFLQTRPAYVAQREAARGLVDHIAGLGRKSPRDVLMRALQYGSGTLALRTLAHDIARARDLDNRIPEWRWSLARFQRELAPSAEAQIVGAIVSPFDELAGWFRNAPDGLAETARERGEEASTAVIRGLDDLMRAAA